MRYRCTIGLNVALMVLFFSLAVTFFLLAGGQRHPRVRKVSMVTGCWHVGPHESFCSTTLCVCILQAGGYLGIWTAGVAWYIAFAELLNEVWFRGRVSHFFVYDSNVPQTPVQDVVSCCRLSFLWVP